MKILVTGARGFVGRNLCAQLNNIRTGKAKGYRDLVIDTVYEYDIDSKPRLPNSHKEEKARHKYPA